MFILLEVSDPSRVSIVPCDDAGDAVTVSQVGRGTLLDIVRVCNDRLNPPSDLPHGAGWVDPDNEVDEDGDEVLDPTPLYEPKPRAVNPITAFFKK